MTANIDDFRIRLREAIALLTGTDPAGARHPQIGLAVSGGPDSLAMLLLAHAEFPGAVRVATVDHGLRPEAADEAAFVAQVCAARGLDHDILKPDRPITGNLQSAARAVRYRLLDDWATAHGLQWIATAHHSDDQVETLLMRIARGSGIAGLSSIRAVNGQIIRPLLHFRKADLIDICRNYGVQPCSDPSNDNTDFDRVRMRNWLGNAEHPFDPGRVARTVSALNDAHAAMEWTAERLAGERITASGEGGVMLDPQSLPAELVRRLLIHSLHAIEPTLLPRGDTTDRAMAALSAGDTLTIGNVKCTGGPVWHFVAAPPRHQKS